MLKVIDISSHQSVETAGIDGIDAVIVKATQGTGYINPKCDAQYQLAKKKGRLLGVYHYAGGGDPVAEADYFLKNIQGYIHEAVLCLDWEAGQNASWGNTAWCRAFVNRVFEKTGVWCLIYIQASAVQQAANCANDCPLWIAGYPTDAASWDVPAFKYSTSPWLTYTIWQFTSGGGLDRNVAQLTYDAWRKIANPSNQSSVAPEAPKDPVQFSISTEGKSLSILANEVTRGLYGNGEERRNKLGISLYAGVQAIVNDSDVIATLVKETKAGAYGNGDHRKMLLGEYYDKVQAEINGTTRTWTVKNGETLSGIAAAVGRKWLDIAILNGIRAPYTIYPGDKLKY